MASNSTNEILSYAASIDDRFRQIVACVRGLDAPKLNWRPVDGSNSVWALAEHAAGNARAWIIGIAAGDDIGRDRPGEFASSGAVASELVAHIERTAKDVDAALRALDPARLDVRLTPPQELWGEGPPHEISVRDAIVQVVEHASLHLGHMQVTRDLALARR